MGGGGNYHSRPQNEFWAPLYWTFIGTPNSKKCLSAEFLNIWISENFRLWGPYGHEKVPVPKMIFGPQNEFWTPLILELFRHPKLENFSKCWISEFPIRISDFLYFLSLWPTTSWVFFLRASQSFCTYSRQICVNGLEEIAQNVFFTFLLITSKPFMHIWRE